MKKNRRLAISSLLALAASPVAAQAQNFPFLNPGFFFGRPINLLRAIQTDPRLSLLYEAIQTSGLASTIADTPNLTIFAPTNWAFHRLLLELNTTKSALFADKTLLKTVLTYHVLPTRQGTNVFSQRAGNAFDTVQGGIFIVNTAHNRNFQIQDGRNRTAHFIHYNRQLSNGVLHVIDRVLLPANKSIVQTAIDNPNFSILVEALTAANLVDALQGSNPLTVFAPTNHAFLSLLTELGTTKDALLKNTVLLRAVLLYHVLNGRILKAQVPLNKPITPLASGQFSVLPFLWNRLVVKDARNRIAPISNTNILATNGVVHVLDKVILPAA